MNRIEKLFSSKKQNVLNIYFTAGYPRLNDTAKIIQLLENAGVDMIEIGIPFSDSLADGPVIQDCNEKALHNGMSLKLLFNQLKDIHKSVKIPLILMGSLNPIFQFGIEEFCSKCKKTGVDGVIIPDLPMDEYKTQFRDMYKKYDLNGIFLITPETSEKRIRQIDRISKGFVYAVSSSSTTGVRNEIDRRQEKYFQRISEMHLFNPWLIGFGISNAKTFEQACQYSNGAVIGSAFVKALDEGSGNLENKIGKFINSIIQK